MSWAGIYAGGHAGYAGGMSDWNNGDATIEMQGFLGGVQLGINQQIGNVVFGIEGDISAGRVSGNQDRTAFRIASSMVTFSSMNAASSRYDWLAAATVRLGYAAGHWLVYAKGGGAWTETAQDALSASAFSGFSRTTSATFTEALLGWTLGAGAEYALWSNWSAFIEYDYFNFGKQRVAAISTSVSTFSPPTSMPSTFDIDLSHHLVRVGVNYRLGGAAIAQVMPPPPSGFDTNDWTGFYVGAHAGYGAGRKDWLNLAPPFGSFSVAGPIAGGQFGANVQAGGFVFGVETDTAWTNIDGRDFTSQVVSVGQLAASVESRMEWIGTATVRAGFIPFDRWLVYAKAGVALAGERHSAMQTTSLGPQAGGDFFGSGHRLHTGTTIGGGIEYALYGNWSAKAEYNYINFGSEHVVIPVTLVQTGTDALGETIKQSVHLVKVGVNYRFVGLPFGTVP